MDLDQQRIKGAGRAAGVIGQLFMAKHTDRLAAHLAKVMRERPTPRKRTPMSLTPEVFDALRGIPKATIAAAMLRGCIDAAGILGQKAPPRVKIKIGQALELQAPVAWLSARACRGGHVVINKTPRNSRL
jgi:hypothetical protein